MGEPVLLAVLLILGGCSDTCGNTAVSRLLASDEQHEAVMFKRDCRATTGFSTQISILEPVATFLAPATCSALFTMNLDDPK